LKDLSANGHIPAEMLKQAETDTVESLARTKQIMDEDFLKMLHEKPRVSS